MNDDCLTEILLYLSLTDLWAVSETSKRLQAVASSISTLPSVVLDLTQIEFTLEPWTKEDYYTRVFNRFGRLITAIVSEKTDHQIALTNVAFDSCSDNLKSLQLKNYVIHESSEFKEFLCNLTVLRFIKCDIRWLENINDFLSPCEKLVELELDENQILYNDEIFLSYFPALERLSLGGCFPLYDTNENIVDSFFQKHEKLRVLKIKEKDSVQQIDCELHKDILFSIGSHCKLESLHLNAFEIDDEIATFLLSVI